MSKSPNQIFRELWLKAVSDGVLHESDEAVFYLGAQVAMQSIGEGGGPAAHPEYVVNRMCLLLDELIRHRREMAMFHSIAERIKVRDGN